MQLNWEIQNGIYPNIPRTNLIQLGYNLYGSKYPDQVWWFNCKINGTTGEITTSTPVNPTSFPSIIDNLGNDGNVTPNSTNAGWNCMQNWFAYLGYCNQCLRRYIYNGSIQGKVSKPMTLNDLNSTNCIYYQISSITADGEGNCFQNTTYLNDINFQNYQPWFSKVEHSDVNATIKQLWNVWINQSQNLEDGGTKDNKPIIQQGKSLWFNKNLNSVLTAPQTRLWMPGCKSDGTGGKNNAFTIPCSLNLTVYSQFKDDMGSGLAKITTLGSPGYDAQQYIFNEVYDINDGPQQFYIGANTSKVHSVLPGLTSNTGQGAPFTESYRISANSPTSHYNKNPEKFNTEQSAWDNLVLTVPKSTPTIKVDSTTISSGSKVSITDYTGLGSLTAFNFGTGNTGEQSASPLINNSNFNPWNYANGTTNGQSWVLAKYNKSNADSINLGWALESSRYDLYNGLWCYQLCKGAKFDYNKVLQKLPTTSSGIDGAVLWNDLSTGLKGKAAKFLIEAGNLQYAANGQIYMLSIQNGPYSNNMGVRANVRDKSGNVKNGDYLTFSCPNNVLTNSKVTDGWPGWQNMQNQWYGPGNSSNANKYIPWNILQYNCGKYDPIINAPNNSTEDNFGVFSDFNIVLAAYLGMYNDMCGKGINKPNGLTTTSQVIYNGTVLGITYSTPLLGIYEMGYLPLPWFDPNYTPTSLIS